jgi:hypothetical protein
LSARFLFACLLILVAPAMFAFAWQHGIATIGDDSVSYLTLARHFAPGGDALADPWVPWRANFPPLFPLVLAWTGASRDLLAAHLVVAGLALAALVPVWRFAARELASEAGGVVVAALFVFTPNAWIGMKGILSEPLFLLVSMAALAYYAARLEARPGKTGQWLVFGVLLACAYLTRAASVALLIAYGIHAAVRWYRERPAAAWRLALPLAPVTLLVGLWLALRPSGPADAYGVTSSEMIAAWLHEPLVTAPIAARSFLDGWVSSFLAQGAVGTMPRAVLAAFGALALAGAVRKALMNRLDGWYVLVAVGITFMWVFGENNTRRLLYPLVPLLILHAAELARSLCSRLRSGRHRAVALAAVAALPVLACLPAAVVLVQKAQERAPVEPGSGYGYADVVEFYTTINLAQARAEAAQTIAVLDGFDALRTLTPPRSKIMWMRPEYVAVLGGREGVPFYYKWDERRLAREILRSDVDYIVLSWVYKTDLDNRVGDPFDLLAHVGRYSRPVAEFDNAATGVPAFLLVRVDPAGVRAFLGAAGTS